MKFIQLTAMLPPEQVDVLILLRTRIVVHGRRIGDQFCAYNPEFDRYVEWGGDNPWKVITHYCLIERPV